LDSDDSWKSEKIEKQLALKNQNNCSAICSNAYRIVAGLETQLYFKHVNPIITFNDLVLTNKIICSSALIHRSIIKEIGLFHEDFKFRGIEDYFYWLKVASFTNWGCCQEGLINYTDDPENSVRAKGLSEKAQKLNIFEGYMQWNNNQNSKEFISVKKALSKLIKENRLNFLKILNFCSPK
jgi:hypothetical protein